nr:transposase, MuDR, MULE transposase domain protein [Tanacetum cinerariifolium]
MFFKLHECELDVGLKIVECDSDLEAMYEFVDSYGIIQMYLAHIPQNLAEYYFKIFCFDESGDEAICKFRIHENRKKDVGNMSYEELVSWAEEEAQHLKTPPKPRTSNAPDATLDVDEFEYGDTGASFESVDDQTDKGKGKMIEEDNIVNKVVDKGKGKMIEEERPVPARKAMGRNKGIVIEENDNPHVMDSNSGDNEVEMDQIHDYSMTRNSEANRAPMVSKQKPCSDKEAVENGFSECFNVVIVRVENKALITMLEAMRVIVIERMNTMRRMLDKCTDDM